MPSFGGGGAQRAMLLFARELVARGIDVDVVSVHGEGPLTSHVPREARVVTLGARGVLAALPALVAYLRRTRPAVLYSTIAHCNAAALLAGRLVGFRLPVIVREAVVPLSAERTRVQRVVIRSLIKVTYPWARAVIAVSTDVADELARMSDRIRIAVLPTPVVSDELLEAGAAPLEHPWFAPDAIPVVLGVGRLEPQKDFPTLLRAFAAARRLRPLHLMVLGEGPERPALEALSRALGVAPHVQLPGFVDNPFPYLRRAAAFVLSSRYEGMPTALLQAMAFGTPVVSTDCPGGTHEALRDGRLGVLVPVGNVERLAAAIAAAVASPRRPDVAADVRQRFGTRAAATRYLSLVQGH
jgi:glycosyltransferase involved in cell wall biosynthesis